MLESEDPLVTWLPSGGLFMIRCTQEGLGLHPKVTPQKQFNPSMCQAHVRSCCVVSRFITTALSSGLLIPTVAISTPFLK